MNSSNAAYASRLHLADTIIAMDPDAPGLGAEERYQRSQRLLDGTLAAVDNCLSNNELKDQARAMLHGRKPKSYSKETDAAVSMARELWAARTKPCGASGSANDAVSGAIALVSR